MKDPKKIKENDEYAVFKGKEGHEFKILKKGLSEKLRKELSALPIHAFGGEKIMSTEADAEPPSLFEEAMNRYEQSGPHSNPVVEGEGARAAQQANNELIASTLSGGEGAWKRATQEPTRDTSNALSQAPMSSPEDAPSESAATPESETVAAPAETKSVPARQVAREPQRLSYVQEATKEASDYYNDLRNGHITPKTYGELFADKSTVGKIGTLFGLLLSGAGSGLSNQPNALLEMMNKEIERDFEASKTNKRNALDFYKLSHEHELQKAQIEKFARENNLTDEQVRNMRADTYLKGIQAGKERALLTTVYGLEDAGNKLPPGPFKAQYEAQLNGVKNAAEAKMQQDRATISSQLNDPENQFRAAVEDLRRKAVLMPALGKVAEDMEQRHFPGMGLKERTNRPIQQSDRDSLKDLTNLGNTFDKAEDYLKEAGTLGAMVPSEFQAKGKLLQDQMELEIGKLMDLNRFTHEEGKRYKKMIPDLTGTHFTNQDLGKLKYLKEEVLSKQGTIYDSYGVSPNKKESGAPVSANSKAGVITTNSGKRAVLKDGKWFYEAGKK